MSERGVKVELKPRSVVPVVLCVSTAVVLGALLYMIAQIASGQPFEGGLMPVILASPISYVSWQAMQRAVDHLRINVPAGTVEHHRGGHLTTCPLHQLGPVTVTAYWRSRKVEAYRLEAAGLPNSVLIDSIYRGLPDSVKKRLDDAIVQDAVRRVLSGTTVDANAFRAGPDTLAHLRQVIREPETLVVALTALQRDPDADIAARAAEVSCELRGESQGR